MLSRKTEYAIRSLVCVAIKNKEGGRPGFKEVAKEIDAPVPFTAKILQELAKKGLIHSAKGRGGGFFFEQPPEELTLFRVIEIMEGLSFFTKCGFGFDNCSDEHPCPIHDDYLDIRDGFNRMVKETSIGSLADKVMNDEAVLSRIL